MVKSLFTQSGQPLNPHVQWLRPLFLMVQLPINQPRWREIPWSRPVAAAAGGAWPNMWPTLWPWPPCSLQRGGVGGGRWKTTGHHGFLPSNSGFFWMFLSLTSTIQTKFWTIHGTRTGGKVWIVRRCLVKVSLLKWTCHHPKATSQFHIGFFFFPRNASSQEAGNGEVLHDTLRNGSKWTKTATTH